MALTVQFTDQSTNNPTSWSWSFGDGGTSTLQNPSHAYAAAGTYTVSLTATNTSGSNTMTRTNYITATTSTGDPVASVAGLLYRWRADSASGADGTAIQSLPAMTGGVPLVQNTVATRPLYYASGIGGKPVLRFSAHLLEATVTARSQPVSYVIVFDQSALSSMQQIVNNGTEILADGSAYGVWGGSSQLNGGTTSLNPVVLTVVMNGSGSGAYLNGTRISTGNVGTAGIGTTLGLGSYGSTRNLKADWAELMVFDHELTTAQRVTVHSYVQNRYGITVSDYST